MKSLHTAAVDAGNGYDEALRDADAGDLEYLFCEMIALHGTTSQALAVQLQKRSGRCVISPNASSCRADLTH